MRTWALFFKILPLSIQGAYYANPWFIQHMRVDHRRGNVIVAEQFLNGPYVVVCLQQMGREGMSQGVHAYRLGVRETPVAALGIPPAAGNSFDLPDKTSVVRKTDCDTAPIICA